MFAQDDWLMLSEIQHFLFCPRQWALISINQQWNDNVLTVEGTLQHENVDDSFYRLCNSGRLTLRRVPLASAQMGVSGFSDAIELIPATGKGMKIDGYPGLWTPYPIEFKHGQPKEGYCDEAQLAAQVMCLEEMYGLSLDEGALFYAKTRRRQTVKINDELREITRNSFLDMHDMLSRGKIPEAVPSAKCAGCSLIDICMPYSGHGKDVSNYLKKYFDENTP